MLERVRLCAIWTGGIWVVVCIAALVLSFAIVPASATVSNVVPVSRSDPQRVRSTGGTREPSDIRSSSVVTTFLFLPFVARSSCQPIAGESYGVVSVKPPPTDRPAENHPDLNLALRGYMPTSAYLGLVDYDPPTDPGAPQLPGLFDDNRTAAFIAAYRVYDWDWICNCRGAPLATWEVTLAGLAVMPGEIIRVPASGYDLGRTAAGYEVLVLYASTNRITLKYTREDNVINGYTLHLENMCVEPNLLALYQSWNAAGRASLPALFAGQGVGRAMSGEIGVAIRDTGSFMDPRSRKDWWQGR